MLKAVLTACFLFLSAGSTTMLQAQTDDPRARVILEQIDAFAVRDIERAFSYASPSIHDIFQTAEHFAAMVRSGYPMVWDAENVVFLEQLERAGNTVLRVEITGLRGRVFVLDYEFVMTDVGPRINGVRILEERAQLNA